MCAIGVDLGGTKLGLAVFSVEGEILERKTVALESRKGHEVGKLITEQITSSFDKLRQTGRQVRSVGISVRRLP